MKIVRSFFATPSATLTTLFFMVFSLGQLQRFQLSGDRAFYAHDVVIALALIWTFLIEGKIKEIFKKMPTWWKKIHTEFRLELTWAAWIVGSTLIGAITGTVGVKALFYFLRLAAYIAFVLVVRGNEGKNSLRHTLLAITSTLMALWGIIQYALIPDTRFLSIFGWDNHYYRLIGPLFDPAFMGMMLVLTFGWWSMPRVLPTLAPRWKQAIQLVLTAAIAATFSRASYLALFAFIALQTLGKKMRLSFALSVAVIFVVTILILPKPGGEGVNLARTSTNDARLTNAQENLITLRGAQWLWGRGLFNNDVQQSYETPSHAQLPDSLPILILNATGLGGSALTFLVLKKWLTRWLHIQQTWAHLFIATLIHSLFNNTFLQPFIFLSLWLGF